MSVPRRERKVVTVLFADLVGFTARAESLDPEDVDAFLRPYHERLREELERWGGTVEKFIGDAVVAVFGAPVAREDDPERAVRAALAIREWASEDGDVEVRIAVNTGEALVSLDARPESGEGFVTGDVVNTASRLQSAAPVNGVLVGEQTYRGTREVIDYREAEPVVAKGKSEPVSVWEATEARSRFGVDVRQHGGAPLVGRDRELDALTSTLERVKQEREPQLVTLVGVPGIGKSRLVWELFGAISHGEDLVYWRQGRSLAYEERVSFWAVAEMIKAHAGILEDDDDEVAATKLGSAVREVVDEQPDWVIERLLPLVGRDTERSPDRDEAFTAWRTFFEGLAERRPLVLVFEDLHWADEGLLDFVDHLADWSSGVPILVLCTARPELLERRPNWGGGKRNALTLNLSPLSHDDSARLLSLVLQRAVLPAETQQALLERASGNPLYAEQFARLFVERGAIEQVALPESVHGLIAARLDSLPAGEKALLQKAAVMGKVFWSGALDGLSDTRTLLHTLERKEFVRRERRSSVAGEEEYAFRHVLVRDVAYGQIPRGERAAKHLRAAAWIEGLGRPQDHAELLAAHYLSVLELDRDRTLVAAEVGERAAQALSDAAQRAAALSNYPGAVSYARAALDLTDRASTFRARLLLELGRAEAAVAGGGRDELIEAAAAFEAAEDFEQAAQAHVLVALGGYLIGREDELDEQLALATALVADRPTSYAKATVWASRARVAYLAGRYEEAYELGREALGMADTLGADEVKVDALLYAGGARYELGDRLGVDDMLESLEVAKAINSAAHQARVYNNLGIVLRLEGRMPESLAMHDESLAVARRFGMEANVQFALGALPYRFYETGRWDESLETADAFLAGPGGEGGNSSTAHMAIALVSLGRDDPERAVAEARQAVEIAKSSMAVLPKFPGLAILAYVLTATGDVRGGREAGRELIALGREVRKRIAFGGDAHPIWAWDRLGLLEEMLAATATGPRTPWLEAAEAVAAGDWAGAADIYERCGSPVSTALARLHSGRDADVRAALDYFRSVRAPFYERQAEAKLAAIA